MAMIFKGKTSSPIEGLPLLKRDPLLRFDVNGGIRYLFDTAFGWCYSADTPPADAKSIRDMSEHADGRLVIRAGQSLLNAGGGIDFSPLTEKNTYLEVPASVADAIYDNGQKYLACLYMKLPSLSDWMTTSFERPYWCWSDGTQTWQNSVELFTFNIATNSGIKQLFYSHAKALNSRDFLAISSNEILNAHAGQVCQIAVWRSATQRGLRIRSAAGGTNIVTGTTSTDNIQDYSSQTGKIGVSNGWGSTTAIDAGLQAASNIRIYRGFVDALQLSGHDPLAVLDADWDRTMARAVFS